LEFNFFPSREYQIAKGIQRGLSPKNYKSGGGPGKTIFDHFLAPALKKKTAKSNSKGIIQPGKH
jgi:hypothetical protein